MNNIKVKKKRKKNHLEKFIPKLDKFLKGRDLKRLSEYKNNLSDLSLKCLKCGEVFDTNYYNVWQGCGKCIKCYPKSRCVSLGERKVGDFIKELGFEIKNGDKKIIKPLELDIVIESKKLVIEYCGLYWHGSRHKNKNYHLNKLKQCVEKGYRLITIFEDEWVLKQEIVKARLKHILGVSDSIKVRASKVEIKEIEPKVKNV